MEFAANIISNLIDPNGNKLAQSFAIQEKLNYKNGHILAFANTKDEEDKCESLFGVENCFKMEAYPEAVVSGYTYDEEYVKKAIIKNVFMYYFKEGVSKVYTE